MAAQPGEQYRREAARALVNASFLRLRQVAAESAAYGNLLKCPKGSEKNGLQLFNDLVDSIETDKLANDFSSDVPNPGWAISFLYGYAIFIQKEPIALSAIAYISKHLGQGTWRCLKCGALDPLSESCFGVKSVCGEQCAIGTSTREIAENADIKVFKTHFDYFCYLIARDHSSTIDTFFQNSFEAITTLHSRPFDESCVRRAFSRLKKQRDMLELLEEEDHTEKLDNLCELADMFKMFKIKSMAFQSSS